MEWGGHDGGWARYWPAGFTWGIVVGGGGPWDGRVGLPAWIRPARGFDFRRIVYRCAAIMSVRRHFPGMPPGRFRLKVPYANILRNPADARLYIGVADRSGYRIGGSMGGNPPSLTQRHYSRRRWRAGPGHPIAQRSGIAGRLARRRTTTRQFRAPPYQLATRARLRRGGESRISESGGRAPGIWIDAPKERYVRTSALRTGRGTYSHPQETHWAGGGEVRK